MCGWVAEGYDRRMSALPRRRARRVAGTVLAWCGAALYPGVLFLTVSPPRFPGEVAVLLSAGLTALVMALLRRRPLAAHGILLFAWIVALMQTRSGTIAGLEILLTDLAVGYIAAARERRISVPVAVVTCVLQVLSVLAWLSADAVLHVTVVLAMAVTWMTGNSIRVRRAHTEMLREQATAQAVAAERLKIARELHDMVAHSIGIIAIQAGVGGRVIGTQPVEARNALDAIEATSRDTLSGLRRMLTALRRDDPGAAPLGPAPGLADLGRLAAATMDAGVEVEVRRVGEPRPLPPDVDLSAYRIVQEAVTNVVRHAASDRTCRTPVVTATGTESLRACVDVM